MTYYKAYVQYGRVWVEKRDRDRTTGICSDDEATIEEVNRLVDDANLGAAVRLIMQAVKESE